MAPPVGGPNQQDFLQAIREVAVFAWGLTGINGSLKDYARGQTAGEASPQDGVGVWNPEHKDDSTYHSAQQTESTQLAPVEGDPGFSGGQGGS